MRANVYVDAAHAAGLDVPDFQARVENQLRMAYGGDWAVDVRFRKKCAGRQIVVIQCGDNVAA